MMSLPLARRSRHAQRFLRPTEQCGFSLRPSRWRNKCRLRIKGDERNAAGGIKTAEERKMWRLMKNNASIHHRRSIRLKGFDYSQPGGYFITICTQNHECVLGEIVDGQVRLSPAGEIASQCWSEIPKHFPNVELDVNVMMPNHVHGIIIIHP